ncbi:MAG: hypothetical protein QNJ29_03470 [Rhizobiaceae bacterium]|nr:hypothetical protein [Rhizobiaceae bacterium]
MLESLNITQLLSLFFGLYFLSAGAGMLFDRDAIPSMFTTMREDPAVGFLTGLFAFVVGAIIVSVYSQWDGIFETVISLFGWIALAEGILMLAVRKQFLGIFSSMLGNRGLITSFAVLAVALGAAFVWAGLQGF